MKAIIYKRYGNEKNLKLSTIEQPTISTSQILVKVKASSINKSDLFMLQGRPLLLRLSLGLFKPKHGILGADISGIVHSVGSDVKDVLIGDEIIGDLGDQPRYGFSEFAVIDDGLFIKKPASLTFEEAATLALAGGTALKGLHLGHINASMRVLIIGASGGVGSMAALIAKAKGAHVTAAARTHKLDAIKVLGSDTYFDTDKADITKSSQQYDLIFDAACYRNFTDYRRILKTKGSYILAGGQMKYLFKMMLLGKRLSKKGHSTFLNYLYTTEKDYLNELSKLISTSNMKPMIDQIYTIEHIQEAFEYYRSGKTAGKVVIKI